MIACETKSYHYCRQLLNIDKSLIAFVMLITLRYDLSGMIIGASQILFVMKILMKSKNGGYSQDSIDL